MVLLSRAHYAVQHISNIPSAMLRVSFLESWGKYKHAIKLGWLDVAELNNKTKEALQAIDFCNALHAFT